MSPDLSTGFTGITGGTEMSSRCGRCCSGIFQGFPGDRSQLSTQPCGREVGRLQIVSANFRKLEGYFSLGGMFDSFGLRVKDCASERSDFHAVGSSYSLTSLRMFLLFM